MAGKWWWWQLSCSHSLRACSPAALPEGSTVLSCAGKVQGPAFLSVAAREGQDQLSCSHDLRASFDCYHWWQGVGIGCGHLSLTGATDWQTSRVRWPHCNGCMYPEGTWKWAFLTVIADSAWQFCRQHSLARVFRIACALISNLSSACAS